MGESREVPRNGVALIHNLAPTEQTEGTGEGGKGEGGTSDVCAGWAGMGGRVSALF